MRIACPSCAAEYEVPASRMTPRRMVRCERCGNEWVAVQEAEASPAVVEPVNVDLVHAGPEEDLASPPEVAAKVEAMGRLAPSRPPSGRDVGLLAAWIVSIALLVGAMTAVLVWRSNVVQAWPASARLLGSPTISVVPVHAPGGTTAKTAEKPVTHE